MGRDKKKSNRNKDFDDGVRCFGKKNNSRKNGKRIPLEEGKVLTKRRLKRLEANEFVALMLKDPLARDRDFVVFPRRVAESMPQEILVGIFGFLDFRDLAAASLVSLKWRDLISGLDNILWKNLCFAKWPRILAQEGYNYNDDQSNNNNNNTTRISSWKKLYADKTSLDRSWRKKGMNKCTTIRAHAGKLWAAVFDDELLITASADRSMRLWDVNTLRPLRTVDSTHELLTLQFDKQRIVTGGLGNGTVDIWDLHKILEGSTTTTGDNEEDNGDATTTAAAAAAAATAAPVVRPSHSFVAHSRSYMVSSVQYDDQKLVTSGGFSVKIWDFNDQPLKLIAKLPDEDWGLIECVRFDANHSTNFTTTKTKSSNGTTTRLRGGDPNMLMTGSVSGYVRVWDLRTPHTGSVVQFAQPGFTPVNWIQFDSSCGDMWCACDDGKARRWDVRFPAKPIYTLHVCNGNVWRVAYDYEIGVMVTSSEPNVVKVWDMGDKKMAPLSITTDDDDEYSIGIISASTSGQFPCAQTLTPQQGNSFNAKVSSVRMSHSKLVLGTWDGLLKVYEFDKRSFRIVR